MANVPIRNILETTASTIKEPSVGVLLSGGMDSASVLFSLLEEGKKVTAYSFTLEGTESKDFIMASKIADSIGIDFLPIILPSDLDSLKEDIYILAELGCRTKTDFECSWAMFYAYRAIQEKVIASGLGADCHFCLTKKGMIHYKDNIDVFREMHYNSPTYVQQHIHNKLSIIHNKTHHMPYMTVLMKSAFLGTTWDEVNKPKIKQPILDAYPAYFSRLPKPYTQSYQMGEGGISKHFEKLLASDWNVGNHKSVTGIYNRIVKEVESITC